MIRTRGKFVRYGEVWFDEAADPPLPDIIFYRQSLAPVPGSDWNRCWSLVTDLSVDEERVQEKMNRMCRYDIRRAERDGVTCVHDTAPAAATIAEFLAFFDTFAADKSLGPMNRSWFRDAAATGRVLLSSARLDGEILVWHSYLTVGSVARLLHSCSLRRDADGQKKQLVGRANRFLHWRDMVEFQRLGIQTYDWGGIFPNESDPVRKRINDFKREFGGKERCYFDCTAPATLRGRIYLPLVSIIWRSKFARHNTASWSGRR